MIDPEPSWVVFDECPVCSAGPGKPCYKLNSSSLRLIKSKNPHRGRRKIK